MAADVELAGVGTNRTLLDPVHGSFTDVGIALTGAAIFGAFYKQTSPTVLAPWFALGWLVIGAIVTMVMGGRAPASEVLGDLHSEDVGAS